MKFKIVVIVLVVLILGLFTSVVFLANNLKSTNETLQAQKDTLQIQQEALRKRNKEIEDYKNQLLGSVKSEDVYYEIAQEQNTPEAYLDYLQQFAADTAAVHKSEVEQSLNSLMSKKGYVQVIESDQNPLFESHEGYAGGDEYMIAKTAMRVRSGVIGNSEYSPSKVIPGEIISEGQIVKILKGSIPSGSSFWAHVAYAD